MDGWMDGDGMAPSTAAVHSFTNDIRARGHDRRICQRLACAAGVIYWQQLEHFYVVSPSQSQLSTCNCLEAARENDADSRASTHSKEYGLLA